MRLSDDSWKCNNCGIVFDVPPELDANIVFYPVEGQLPERAMLFDGDELHRCVAKSKWSRFGGRPKKVV